MSKKKTDRELVINNELKLIILLIKIKDKPLGNKEINTLKNINWKRFVDLCSQHGVISIVYKKIRTLNSSIIPESIVLSLKKLYQQIVQWNFIQSNQLVKVLKILQEKDIRAIPIKGLALSMQAYGDIGYRMFQDIDLLVLPEDFIKVYDFLCSNGYQPSSELSGKMKKLWKRYRRDIEFRKNRSMIDLHQRISQDSSSFDITEEMYEKNGIIEILGQKIEVLSTEDTIIYLSINSTKDQWNMLRMIADLSFLIYSNPKIEWDIVLNRSRRMGILLMVLTGLNLMMDITGESLPGIVAEEIVKNKQIKYLSDEYKNNLLFKGSKNITKERISSIFRTLDSPFYKIRFLSHFIFAPTQEDFKWIKLPGFLYFLYVVLRPLRLGVLALRNKK